MLILEAILIIFMWVFVRDELGGTDTIRSQRYPSFQDVNVMMLIGFGFLVGEHRRGGGQDRLRVAEVFAAHP